MGYNREWEYKVRSRELQTKKYEKTVREILDQRKENRVFLDESFQVGTLEKSRWGIPEMKRYFRSIILGKAISPIVWINVKACYEYWSTQGTSKEDTEYFKDKLDKGYDLISLDGNNREITLIDVDKGVVSLPADNYDLDKTPNIKVNRGSDKINTLSKHLIDKFYNTKIPVVEYINISIEESGEAFRAINDGMTLNSQAKRQSRSSRLAQWVRDMRKKYISSLQKAFGEKDIITLKADEFIAKCLCYTSNEEHNGSALDNMYKNPGTVISNYLGRDRSFESLINSFWKEIKTYKWTSKNSLFDLWVILSDYKKFNNTKISDIKSYVACYYKHLTTLVGQGNSYNIKHLGIKESVLDYSGLLTKTFNPKIGEYRRNIIRNLIEKELGEDIIVQQEDPKNRFFTKKQKQQLHSKQNGICPETNKPISLEDIFDYTKWQADHIVSFDKGGRTTIENGQLICAVANLQKSNN